MTIELNTIYNEDCLEGMKRIPDKSLNSIITDPPYNISRKNNFETMGRLGIDFGEWDRGFDQLSWMGIAKDKLVDGGSLIIFNDWKNLGDIARHAERIGLEVKDPIRWIKDNPMPRNRDRRYITDFEFAVWLVTKKGKWTFNRFSETYDRPEYNYPVVGGKEKLGHPTQKPLKLMEEIVLRHTNPGDVILDPFIGSGTTAEACLKTGRKFIGFETDENSWEMANKRIEEHKEGTNND